MRSATSRMHVESRRLLAGVVFAVSVCLTAAGMAHAAPPRITDTFATGDDGWEIYEGASEYGADWISSGGNPGGFIRYSDLDAASSSAVFADENYVSHIARYDGVSDIVFDLKTDAADARKPRAWITDPDDADFPAIHSDLKRAPDANWHHYALPLDARAARWVDGDGDRVSQSHFEKILDRNPVFVVRADYSSSAPEQTDFDSVGIVPFTQRKLTLSYRSKTGKLKGRLTTKGGSQPQCTASQKVKLMRVKPGADMKIGSAKTNGAGRYTLVRRSLKKGRYYAAVPQVEPAVAVTCLAAKSMKIKRK